MHSHAKHTIHREHIHHGWNNQFPPRLTIAPGETIKVFSKVSPCRAFPVKVTEFTPGPKMLWSGGMPLGLFKGVRTYTLTPQGNGTTTFHMREEYTGPLTPMIWKSMPDLGPSFTQFANGLKQRAESST